MELLIDTIASEIGPILIVSDGDRLCAVEYADYEERMTSLLRTRYGQFQLKPTPDPIGFSSRLRAYLDGDYAALDSISVNPGGTTFQQHVWTALRTIPPGTTLSYSDLAQKLGKPTAYRAVGMANSLNPVSIVIPCHRVIGANATLTGYAGGLERKRWLLQHEGVDMGSGSYKQLGIALKGEQDGETTQYTPTSLGQSGTGTSLDCAPISDGMRSLRSSVAQP